MRKNNPVPTLSQALHGRGRGRQRGMALVMSLVFLMILTILGISAMGTSTLEEKMSGNIQEGTHAFEAAESGLSEAFNTSGALSLSSPSTTYTFNYDSSKYKAVVTSTFTQFSSPKRGSGYGNNFNAANFDQTATGTTTANAKSVISQGIGLIVPKAN